MVALGPQVTGSSAGGYFSQRPGGFMIEFDVCPGVHAVVHAHTNCFMIEGDGGVTLVDAAYPSTWAMGE
jgi:hypothetical protein